jgi:hypothetical protein
MLARVNGEWSDSVLFGNLTPASLVLPADYRPELALDAARAAHILRRTWPQGNVYYGTQPVGGVGRYLVAAGLDDGSLPRMAVDPSGNAHLTWQSGTGSRRDIFALRRGADGSWSAIETITAQDPYLVDARNPVIAVDITGTAFLAWENGAGFFAWRPVGGEWSAPSPILAWPFNLSRPQLAVDAGGIAHVAWQAAKTGQPNAIAYARFRIRVVAAGRGLHRHGLNHASVWSSTLLALRIWPGLLATRPFFTARPAQAAGGRSPAVDPRHMDKRRD